MTQTAPARPVLADRPALARLRRHVLDVCKSGDPKRCDLCRQLEADASAESWKRSQRRVGGR
jgi:hypothetical protein